MKASVIIPTYNRSELLKYTLFSLITQDFPSKEYEVIVIDDGSSDNTKEVVDSFKSQLRLTYYFQEDKGFRVALARNEGIKRAKGDVMIFIDTGVVVGETFVREHYNAHFGNNTENSTGTREKYAVIGYVYGFSYEYENGAQLPDYIDFNRPNQMITKLRETNYFHDMREEIYSEFNDDLSRIPVAWFLFYTNNVSVEREELLAVGCFDETFIRWGVEDVECAYRLQKNNIKFKLSREACGVHYPHERHVGDNYVTGRMNMRKFYKKFQEDVVELYTTARNFDFIHQYMSFSLYTERLGEVPLFSSILSEEAVKYLSEEIAPQKNIVFGCQDGALLDICKSAAATEADINLFLKARDSHLNVDLHRGLGVRTFHHTRNFDISLIAGAAIVLDKNFINNLVDEALRVSKAVYWLKVENSTDVTDYPYSEVRKFENGVSLCKIEPNPNIVHMP